MNPFPLLAILFLTLPLVEIYNNSSSSSFFPFCVSTLEGVPDPDPPDGAASNSVFKPEPAPKLTPSAE